QQQKLAKLASDHQLAAVTKDLELTGAVQIGFLPREPAFQLGNVAVQGYYRPAGTCSGDWWWHEEIGPSRSVIVVGDVTGHGPGPAMVTAAVATAFRVTRDLPIGERIRILSEQVLRVSEGKYLMTFSALVVDR